MSATKQAIGPNQEKWLRDLESGGRKQGMGLLCTGDRFCCLGVGAELFCPELRHEQLWGLVCYGPETAFAPVEVIAALALKDRGGCFGGEHIVDGQSVNSLVAMNDAAMSFADIAAFCRANPGAVFTEPR